jgi:5-methyltetrahydrofolate--homocysteine methyltransferase
MDLKTAIGRGVLVADGAMGTELQRAGLGIGESGERWVLEHPDRISAIHRRYVEAGADLTISSSFGANARVLGRSGLADRMDEINRSAARIARDATPAGRWVLGDVGPTGALMEPLGDLTLAELRSGVERQVRALLDGGADGIIIETMTALEEAAAAVEAARQAGATFVIASMAFDRVANGRIRTMMGVAPEAASARLTEAGADVIGANCGTRLAVHEFAELVALFRSASDRPVMIQPNAGQPRLVGGHAVYSLTPAEFAAGMSEVIRAGAAIVGGCCGTTPAHIAALARLVNVPPEPLPVE